MDNDDDFRNQSFQLIAEDNSKFPSSLRLFSLPKFDLDDHLQFHLRFDGLAEQESLLSIQDQEQNNWIEDFSPDNNALELSSSAAESCSISRQKNVWSEATSSESVEMLLKSVGEDHMMNKRINIIYSESHSGLNSVSDHMDPCCSQDDSLQSKEGRAVDADPVFLAGQCDNASSSLNKDVSAVQPDMPDLSDTCNDKELESRNFEVLSEVSKGEKANNPRKVVAEQCGLNERLIAPTVESVAIKEKSFGSCCSETTNSGNFYDDFVRINGSNDDSARASLVAKESQDVSTVPIDQLASSIGIPAHDSDGFPTQKFDEHVSESYGGELLHMKSQNLVEDGGNQIESATLTRCSGLEMQPSVGNMVENNSDSPEYSSSLKQKAESPSSLIEGYNGCVASEKDCLSDNVAYQINTQSRGNGIGGQILRLACEMPLLITEKHTNSDGHSVEIGNTNIIQHSSLVDSLEQAKEVSSDASVESRVLLKDHHMHDESLKSVKNGEVVGNCEGKQLEEPAIRTEEIKDAGSSRTENKKLMELSTLNDTNFETQKTDKEEDNNLGIHPPEPTFQGPESLGIQKSAGNVVLENDRRMLDDTVNGPKEIVQEGSHAPGPCFKHDGKAQFSPSQDDRSLEKPDVIVELDDRSSDARNALLRKKWCSIFPASLDDTIGVEKLQDASSPSQIASTCLLEGHVVQALACVTTQVESVNSKETFLQSLSLPRSSSETCLLKDDGGNLNSSVLSCGSPVIISCTESSVESHQQELKKGLSDQSDPLSGKLPQVASLCRSSDKNESTVCDPKDSNTSVEGRSFVLEVGSLLDTAGKEAAELLKAGEISSATSGSKQVNCSVLGKTSGEIHVPAEVAKKSPQQDKTKAASRSLTEKRTSSKRKSVKEMPIVNQSDERDGNPCNTPINTVGTMSRPVQLEIRQHPLTEGDCVKSSCASSVQTSNLSDSKNAMPLFHQPFTDKQQVQLRAQIFVYGSLIQGVPPDETCMISAFGNADGGQRTWEGVWRVALERFHSQKSPTSNCVSVPHSQSGGRISEKISSSSPLQGKSHGTPVSQTSKVSPPVIFDSPVSLPAPLWNLSTPQDALQSKVSEGPYLESSEASPLPLVASSKTSILDARASHVSVLPVSETFQVTPRRNSSFPYTSNPQPTMSGSFTTAGVPLTPVVTPMQMEPTKKTESSRLEKHANTKQKTRRKKGVVSELPVQLVPRSHLQAELDSTSTVSNHPPTMTVYTLPTASPVVPSKDIQVKGNHVNEKKGLVLEETCDKTVQAKLQAEDAAAVAAAAVRHSEGIWSQLSAQKNSGLVSEKEVELAYAAVAAAAASSVAKAAAAVAKVASDAALQAKMMADEALSGRIENSMRHSEIIHTDGGTCLSGGPPILILKGKDKTNNSSSIISAAKEAARRRVEAASAAAKRAENLDTIVQAAELAALAVSQAGAVIAMGDPLPFTLSDLIEAGPEGYWKVQNSVAGMHKEKQMALGCTGGLNNSVLQLCSTSLNEKNPKQIADGSKSSPANELNQSVEEHSGGVAPLPFDVSAFESEKDQTVKNLKKKTIQEGSLVEVLSNENGLRRIWCSATVVNLKYGQAFVCYNDHPNAGSDKQNDWIPLEGECDKPPRIRITHSTTGVKYEATRKRRRPAVGNYAWAVGDRVDAWLHHGWCEGIVTERSKEDETKLTVHFTAGGDTSVVRAWHLRPSLIWKDGQWIEWSRPRENILHPYVGDTPQEKRQKLVRVEENDNEVMNTGANNHSANFQIQGSQKPEDTVVLSEKDKISSLGKCVKGESNSGTLTIKRTGLQKEGSRVIFGIPKPGKRRKFMEVSKHYVTEKPDRTTEGSGSIKYAKYLVPQSSRSWKNTKSDSKGRQGTANHEENSEMSQLEAASISNNFEAEGKQASDSHQRLVPGITSSKKKTYTVRSDLGMRGKVAPSLGEAKLGEKHSYLYDHPGNAILDAVEPRRSNRRIQPTSRLLEGLQSSMIVTKTPSLPQDKGARASHRNVLSSGGNAHG